MQVLSDLQAEQLCGGHWGRPFAASPFAAAQPASTNVQRCGSGRGRWFGGGRGLMFQSILNTVNQINFAINIAIGGGSIFNNQVNVLTMQSSL
jgi:hypothetical protein